LGAINHSLLLLRQGGPDDPGCAYRHVRNMHITNIVISGKFFHFLDLKSQLAANASNLRSSEKFPGVYVEDEFLQKLRGGNARCNFSLYPSGAFVCNSARSVDDAISIVEIVRRHVEPLAVPYGKAVPVKWARTGTSARRTPRKIHQVGECVAVLNERIRIVTHAHTQVHIPSAGPMKKTSRFSSWQTKLAKDVRAGLVPTGSS
jgi:hypothetical protein